MKSAAGLPALLLLALCNAARAQESPPVALPATFQHELRSGQNGGEYRLFVSLPQEYEAGGAARYPVLFVLDGNAAFPLASAIQHTFSLFGEIPDLIVVGIGYPVRFFNETVPRRWRDYTPVADLAMDSARSAQLGVQVHSGGGADFLEFLRNDVIPFVEANYRTTQDRAIWGHSLGGLFAAYALLAAPDLFDRYGISSPSLDFGGDALFVREATYADEHDALPARVFLSVGSEEADLLPHTERFATVVRQRDYQGLALESHVFADETHVSVFPSALSRSLRYLYRPDAVR